MNTIDNAPAEHDAGPSTGQPNPHGQSGYQVRMDWGLEGALLHADAHVVVLVDVLSFSTTVEVAVGQGVEVFPWGTADAAAETFAREHGAEIAGPRGASADVVTLSPGSVTADTVAALGRTGGSGPCLVLPSPNGGAIARALAERDTAVLAGTTVLAGGLRNRTAIAEWVLAEQERMGSRASVAVIAAGELRPDGTLRPAVEDLLAAGAIVDALTTVGIDHCSPEAAASAAAFDGLRRGIGHLLSASASAEELRARGFADDTDVARQVDVSRTVPVLREFSFRA